MSGPGRVSGDQPFRAEVGVVGLHIARAGDVSRRNAAVDLDATGNRAAPDFINLHAPAAPGLFTY